MAYHGKAPVNWCPKCQVVLANEQVEGGECWRCETRGRPQRPGAVALPHHQICGRADGTRRHRLAGAHQDHAEQLGGQELRHRNLLRVWTIPALSEKEIKIFHHPARYRLRRYLHGAGAGAPARGKTDHPEQESGSRCLYRKEPPAIRKSSAFPRKKKRTAFLPVLTAINRLNGEKVPIWIADYVLASYGTGAVMAVPAHDERDFAFAKKYDLPIHCGHRAAGLGRQRAQGSLYRAGKMVNSGQFNGNAERKRHRGSLEIHGGKRVGQAHYQLQTARLAYLPPALLGRAHTHDLSAHKCGIVPVPEKDLPVLLPEDAEFRPTGESPLKYNEEFVNTTCPKCGGPAKRETDTLDGFMCSCWYFLRYTSPHYAQAAFDPKAGKHWMPVDIYTGGAEHAVMHLFYTRFFIKAIRDMGIVDFGEPFLKLVQPGHHHRRPPEDEQIQGQCGQSRRVC